MATATMTLVDGTVVTLEGAPEEVHRLLQLYSASRHQTPEAPPQNERSAGRRPRGAPHAQNSEVPDPVSGVVNRIKSSPMAEAIETNVLDQRNRLNRVLLPLYIIHEEMQNSLALTSGEISNITKQLGVPVGQPDVSNLLASEAARFVLGDSSRARGKIVRYKLSRRGAQYFAEVLAKKPPRTSEQ